MKVIVGAEMRYIDIFEEPKEPEDSSEIINNLRNRLNAMDEDK